MKVARNLWSNNVLIDTGIEVVRLSVVLFEKIFGIEAPKPGEEKNLDVKGVWK